MTPSSRSGSAAGRGRGIIAVSGHIGSIEIFAGAYRRCAGSRPTGWPTIRPIPSCSSCSTSAARAGASSIIPWRNLRRHLQGAAQPAVLGMVVDWGYRSDDVPVRLFGAGRLCPPGRRRSRRGPARSSCPSSAADRPTARTGASHDEPSRSPTHRRARCSARRRRSPTRSRRMVAAAPEQWYTFKPMWPATRGREGARLAARAAAMAGKIMTAVEPSDARRAAVPRSSRRVRLTARALIALAGVLRRAAADGLASTARPYAIGGVGLSLIAARAARAGARQPAAGLPVPRRARDGWRTIATAAAR